MRELSDRGVKTDFLYGAGDVGLDEARQRFGADLRFLESFANVSVRILHHLDHSLFLAESRDAFATHLVHHIKKLQTDVHPFSSI